MHRLHIETNWYGLERQRQLLGEQRRERVSLSDGWSNSVRQWGRRAAEWLTEQLAYVGKSLPCLDNDLACDMQFVR
jgi:hypothetical protein